MKTVHAFQQVYGYLRSRLSTWVLIQDNNETLTPTFTIPVDQIVKKIHGEETITSHINNITVTWIMLKSKIHFWNILSMGPSYSSVIYFIKNRCV